MKSIGKNLKEIRTKKNLTLSETETLTGVSKPMLGQIERGKSVPTINTLWKIATGLKVPLSSLIKESGGGLNLSVIDASSWIAEEGGKMRVATLFPFDPIRGLEVFKIVFDPGCRHRSDPHDAGVEEYVLVISGEMTMEIGEDSVLLSKERNVSFRADVPHAYVNKGEEPCEVYNVITYQNL